MSEQSRAERIAEIRKRLEAASPGPWKVVETECGVNIHSPAPSNPAQPNCTKRKNVVSKGLPQPRGGKYAKRPSEIQATADCAFIAANSVDVPLLLALHDRAEALAAAVEGEEEVCVNHRRGRIGPACGECTWCVISPKLAAYRKETDGET